MLPILMALFKPQAALSMAWRDLPIYTLLRYASHDGGRFDPLVAAATVLLSAQGIGHARFDH